MTIPALLVCPNCRFKFELEQAIQEVEGRQFVELLMSLPSPVQRSLYNYIKLFTPEKQAMTWGKALKALKELAPLIKEAKIQRNKVAYSVPVPVWVSALSYLVETPPATLTLPLKGNGYLLSVLVAQADKAVADAAEKQANAKQAEKDYANRAVAATVKQVHAESEQKVKEKAPINPEFQQKVGELLRKAQSAPPMTAEEKAEQQRKLEQLKVDAKQQVANLSDYEKAELEKQRLALSQFK
jgi:hypothetical protein